MKKNRILFFVFFLIFTSAFLLFKINTLISNRKEIEKIHANLPLFSFKSLDNKIISNSSLLNQNGKIIFYLFSPNCEHCEYMGSVFMEKGHLLKRVKIFMISHSDRTSIFKYVEKYKINSMENVSILVDEDKKFEKIFGNVSVPSFFIYNNKRLIKKISGETKIDNLIN